MLPGDREPFHVGFGWWRWFLTTADGSMINWMEAQIKKVNLLTYTIKMFHNVFTAIRKKKKVPHHHCQTGTVMCVLQSRLNLHFHNKIYKSWVQWIGGLVFSYPEPLRISWYQWHWHHQYYRTQHQLGRFQVTLASLIKAMKRIPKIQSSYPAKITYGNIDKGYTCIAATGNGSRNLNNFFPHHFRNRTRDNASPMVMRDMVGP